MIKNREAAHRANACEQSLHVGRERATKTGVSNQEENVLKQDRSSSDLPQACSIASGTKVICKGATMATVMPPHCSPARIDCHTSISGRERLRSPALVLGSPVRVLSARVHGRASQSAYYERSRRHSGASSGRPAAHACALRAAGTECTRICRTNLFWYLSTVPAVDHFLIFTTSPTPLLTLLVRVSSLRLLPTVPHSASIPPTVRLRGIETGISEASKRVSIFSFATQGGKQVSFYF